MIELPMIMNMFVLRRQMTMWRFEKLGLDSTSLAIWAHVNTLLFNIRAQLKEDADDRFYFKD